MRENTHLLYIALSLVKNLGHISARKLIQSTGGIEHLFKENRKALRTLMNSDVIINEILKGKTICKAEKELQYIERINAQCLTLEDTTYPYRLKECPDAPIILYKKGRADLNSGRFLSVVGTRKHSSEGRQLCEKLISGLRNMDVSIVSGLALGIDTLAHETALNNSLRTVAVLGHGLNKIYPWSNRYLAGSIEDEGALITELSTAAPMVPGNFPARNRIIAGLSDATIVVESGTGGGSIITADLANSYDRDVYAFPFSPFKVESSGGNMLIRENKAALIENSDDLLKLLNWGENNNKVDRQFNLFNDLSNEENTVIELLRGHNELNSDSLSVYSGIPIYKMSAILTEMELKNLILCKAGSVYQLPS